MQLERFDHVSFTVGELERSVEFYGRFGYEQVRRMRGRGIKPGDFEVADLEVDIVWLRRSKGWPILELVKYLDEPVERARANSRIGAAHLCFAVTDLHAAHKELVGEGIEFLSEPRVDQHGTGWVYLRDPDGNAVELLQGPPIV
jgi:catechol 2,3-dioxygenase-like lactoylglutathione lyase family enzyme